MLSALSPGLKSRSPLRSRNLLTLIPRREAVRTEGLQGASSTQSFSSHFHYSATGMGKTGAMGLFYTEQTQQARKRVSQRKLNNALDSARCALSGTLTAVSPTPHTACLGAHAQLTVVSTHVHGAVMFRNTIALHMPGAEWCSAQFAG